MQLSQLLQLRQVVISQANRWRWSCRLLWRRWLLIHRRWWWLLLLCCLLILHVSNLLVLLGIRLLLLRRFISYVMASGIGDAAYCSGS